MKKAKKFVINVIKVYDQAKKLLLSTQVAKLYIILEAFLYYRIDDRTDQVLYKRSRQRLTLEEEKFIKIWLLQIHQLPVLRTMEQILIH